MRIRLTAAMLVVTGCGVPEAPAPHVGPDCTALAGAARRAAACDRALPFLSDELLRTPDEAACRATVRTLLERRSVDPVIRSLYELPGVERTGPLTAAEREALGGLPLPSALTIVPDLPLAPGVPLTQAVISGESVPPSTRGQLRATVAPGRHTVILRHAGQETTACVSIDACETLTLIAHGARLASHPRVEFAACSEDSPEPPLVTAEAEPEPKAR